MPVGDERAELGLVEDGLVVLRVGIAESPGDFRLVRATASGETILGEFAKVVVLGRELGERRLVDALERRRVASSPRRRLAILIGNPAKALATPS